MEKSSGGGAPPPPMPHLDEFPFEGKKPVKNPFVPIAGQASFGVVIRNHSGSVLLSAGNSFGQCSDTEEIEAIACLEGLKVALEFNMPVILETDCAAVHAASKCLGLNRSIWCGVYREISNVIQLLPAIEFVKVRRECNRVAHEIASFIRVSGTHGVWRDQVPESVLSYLEFDCNATLLS